MCRLQEVLYVISGTWADGDDPLSFAPFYGPARPQKLAGRVLPLFALTWEPRARPAAVNEIDSLVAGMRAASLSATSMRALAEGERARALEAVFAAAATAVAFSPTFDEIKLRYTIGKQTFYEVGLLPYCLSTCIFDRFLYTAQGCPAPLAN